MSEELHPEIHRQLQRGQSLWIVLKTYPHCRRELQLFERIYKDAYQYVPQAETILVPQPPDKRETQRHTFARFTTIDRDPVNIRGSEAIVWMPVPLPWGPNKDAWMRTQQLMKKWEVKA